MCCAINWGLFLGCVITGDSLDRFRKCLGGFYTPTYHASVIQIWHDSLHRFGVIAEKPRVGRLGRIFRAPCRKNYALDRKMNSTFFDGLDELYRRAKFVEDRTTRTGCRCENMVFVCFFLSRSEAGALFVRQWHTLNRCCGAVYASILMMLTFFSIGYPFKGTREFWLLLLGGATIFTKLRTKISKSPQIGRKVGAHDFL